MLLLERTERRLLLLGMVTHHASTRDTAAELADVVERERFRILQLGGGTGPCGRSGRHWHVTEVARLKTAEALVSALSNLTNKAS